MAEEDKCPSLIALQSLSNLQFSMYCTTYTVAQTTTTATMCASSAEPGGALQAPFEFSGLKASDVASHSNQLPNQSASVASLPNRKTRNSCAKRKDDGSHRARSNFNEAQLMCLERSFDASPYASLLTRAKLSYETGISEAKIQVRKWFFHG
uniref:Homeobox domain-containing protein n=1 Tax=Bursaphelenchus xylophilus TaxID=6326 RepID=A0A1I7RIP4_BURXY